MQLKSDKLRGSRAGLLGLTDEDIRGFYATGKVCGDDRGVIDGRATGVVRLSFGLYSTFSDVDRWMEVLMHFVDQLPQEQPSMVASDTSVPEKVTELASGTGTISALKVYPVKGCGALEVKRWPMDGASLFLDRRWCLTLASRKRPVSAKQAPRLTNVRLSLKQEERRFVLVLSSKFHPQKLEMVLNAEDSQILLASGVQTFEDQIDGESSNTVRLDEEEIDSAAASAWFEQLLNIQGLQLLRAAPSRSVPGTGEAPETSPAKTDFANAPKTLLMVSTASLKRFGEVCGLGTVPVERFRANLEVNFPEDQAYEEMAWPSGLAVQVGGADTFEVAGKCVRCQAIDIDPDGDADATAESSGPSLLAALATAEGVGGSTSKGPTFGVLLRKRPEQTEQPEQPELRILEVNMALQAIGSSNVGERW